MFKAAPNDQKSKKGIIKSFTTELLTDVSDRDQIEAFENLTKPEVIYYGRSVPVFSTSLTRVKREEIATYLQNQMRMVKQVAKEPEPVPVAPSYQT